MTDENPIAQQTFRYPALYRMAALFGVCLFVLIVVGSLLAGIDAVKRHPAGLLLPIIGLIGGVVVILWGLDFATRAITITPEGLSVRWAVGRSMVPWSDVLSWRYLPLSLIRIRLRRGPGLFLWPLLENYTDLLNQIDAHRHDRWREEALSK